MVWLTGGALAIATVMILGLLALVVWQGLPTFWPGKLVQVATHAGRTLAGEVAVTESYRPESSVVDALPEAARASARSELERGGGTVRRRMLRTGNYEVSGTHFNWVNDLEVAQESEPEWMLLLERLSWGRFYGTPRAITIDGARTEAAPEEVWKRFEEHHSEVRARWERRHELEVVEIGEVNHRIEAARLRVREAELEDGAESERARAARTQSAALAESAEADFRRIQQEIAELRAKNARYSLELDTADGMRSTITLEEIVRAFPPNRLSTGERIGVYLSRTAEFLFDEPREANSEGGVFPAIFGTVLMTLIMAVLVVPFGVLAALYLREYAKPGPIVSAVRIAINNLAGVPSIVFGVFGLGFFCYIVGVQIDELLFAAKLPTPTYGKGGLVWASLTLALLTLPVVIVPTEEALSSVPSSMREGSYACGATKWQTIWRIVLPRAMPGIMTGMILALARGAGEVAPLMLVGAVKLAPELPLDATVPFLHPERSFMHLGFHIYDLGFQSQNSEAAKPMVYTTTLLLIALVVTLNLLAIWIRARLRRRFQGNQL
jgi:phosphate transport system permease protein